MGADAIFVKYAEDVGIIGRKSGKLRELLLDLLKTPELRNPTHYSDVLVQFLNQAVKCHFQELCANMVQNWQTQF